jgi:WXG100 family type VII secretion target
VSAEGALDPAVEPYLAHLSELAEALGLIDPIEAYLRPLLGRWAELRAEADRLRRAAAAAGSVSAQLADGLGKLDAGWSGQDADAFIAYMGEIRAASGDLQDALDTLARSLDEMVTTLHHVVVDLVEVLVDTAEVASESAALAVGGAGRARAQIQESQQSAKALFEVARDVLEEFGRLCDGVDDPDGAARSIEIAHRYPQERFGLHDADGASQSATSSDAGDTTTPSAAHEIEDGRQTGARQPEATPVDGTGPAAEPSQVVAGGANTSAHGGMGMPMIPMGFGGMGIGMGGGAARRPAKNKTVGTPSQLVGEPGLVVPPVIGDEEATPKPAPKPPPSN